MNCVLLNNSTYKKHRIYHNWPVNIHFVIIDCQSFIKRINFLNDKCKISLYFLMVYIILYYTRAIHSVTHVFAGHHFGRRASKPLRIHLWNFYALSDIFSVWNTASYFNYNTGSVLSDIFKDKPLKHYRANLLVSPLVIKPVTFEAEAITTSYQDDFSFECSDYFLNVMTNKSISNFVNSIVLK